MDPPKRLADELAGVIDNLHGLFDEIGLARYERDTREQAVYTAISAALHEQLRVVAQEKAKLVDEARQTVGQIKQMERSLADYPEDDEGDDDEEVTLPLLKCVSALKERHKAVKRRHAERYDSVKKLVQALETYASRLEQSFVQIALPPITNDSSALADFDLSHNYYEQLEEEFNRVYQEFTRRLSTVEALAKEIINLYAELGIPATQIDRQITEYGATEPQRLGLTKDDIERLKGKKAKLMDERERRRSHAEKVKREIGELWTKLDVEEAEKKMFLAQNRGCDMRTIQELEDELNRLLEVKRDNMHIFVDDARHTLQDLWDKLYFSGEDIMEFSPAHSEVYTDALLSAHEMEIKRLQVMLGERAPILSLINKHHELMDDKEQLAISSNDASRLMARGTKGERDPTRLLREEKMRKRVAKELPRVEVELKKALEQWEEDYGEPLLVKGENYLDTILQHSPIVPPARTKTPGPGGLPRGRSNTTSSLSSHSSQSAQRAKSRPNIKENVQMKPPPRSKTPTARPKTPGATTQSYVYSGASTVGRSGGRSLVSVIDRGTTGTTVTPSLGITPSLGPRLRAANSNTSPTRGSRAPLQTFHTSTQPIKQPEPQAPSTIGRNSSIKRKFGPSAANVFGTVPKMLALQQLNEMQQKTLTPYMRHQLELEQHEREDDTRLSQGGASIRSVSPYGSDAPSYRSYNGHDDSNSPTSDTRATPRAKSYRPNMKNFMEYESSVRGSQTSVDSRQFSSSTMSTISSASTPEGGGSENWEVYGEDSDGEQQPAAYYRPKNRGAYGSNGSSSSVGLVRQGAREEGWLSESGGVGGGGNAY